MKKWISTLLAVAALSSMVQVQADILYSPGRGPAFDLPPQPRPPGHPGHPYPPRPGEPPRRPGPPPPHRPPPPPHRPPPPPHRPPPPPYNPPPRPPVFYDEVVTIYFGQFVADGRLFLGQDLGRYRGYELNYVEINADDVTVNSTVDLVINGGVYDSRYMSSWLTQLVSPPGFYVGGNLNFLEVRIYGQAYVNNIQVHLRGRM